MTKKIILLLLFILYIPKTVLAADLTINCQSDSCQLDINQPIFSLNNIYPNYSITKSVNVINSRSDNCSLNFSANSEVHSPLLDKTHLSALQSNHIYFSGSLTNLHKDSHYLGDIPANTTREYLLVLSLNQDLNNDYSNLNTSLDFNFNFICQEDSLIVVNSIPSTVKIGDTFPINFSVYNASPNTSYYIKVYGGQNNENYSFQTINESTFLNYNNSWTDFPIISTDSNGQILSKKTVTRIKPGSQAGDYTLKLKLAKISDPTIVSNQITSQSILLYGQLDEVLSQNSTSSPPSSNVCSDIAPIHSPEILRIVAGTNQVTLFWREPPPPFTYYLITYGDSPNTYQYGNPNIGGVGTTSYTITHLSADQPYYFRIRTGNGCTPGPFSEEFSATPLGSIIYSITTPAPNFLPNILGEQTNNKDQENKNLGKIEGVNDQDKNLPYLLGFALFTPPLIFIIKNKIAKN